MRYLTISLSIGFLVSFLAINAEGADDKALYEGKCKICHGVDCKGSSSVAKMYKIEQDLLDLTNQKSKKMTDAEIAKVVREGQGKMKPVPSDKLSDVELKAIISHVRTLQK